MNLVGNEQELIDAVAELMGRLVRDPKKDLPELRTEAHDLIVRLEHQQRMFAACNGLNDTSPTTRAWYLLKVATEHATLLRESGT